MAVSFFEEILSDKYHLRREGGYLIVEEESKNTKNNKFRISAGKAFGFSLDANGDCFPFIKSNTTKKGIRSVCDGLIVFFVDDIIYFCCVDLKSTKVSNGLSQIESGRLFLNWIVNLARCHNHWNSDVVIEGRFFGIVSLVGRNTPRKGVTNRRSNMPEKETSKYGNYPIFILKNKNKVDLKYLAEIF